MVFVLVIVLVTVVSAVPLPLSQDLANTAWVSTHKAAERVTENFIAKKNEWTAKVRQN